MSRTIWLTSYPKSGHTWFRILIANLASTEGASADINDLPGRSAAASGRAPFERLLLIDSSLLTHDEIDCLRPRVYEELARRVGIAETAGTAHVCFMSAHEAYVTTAKGEPLFAGRRGGAGAILLVRDPRDVVCSLAHYNRMDVDDAITFVNDARIAHDGADRLNALFRQQLSGWSAHAESWLRQTDLPVHVVRYEDMRYDAPGTFRSALDFAGLPADDETIRRAVVAADFSELQSQEQNKGFRELPWPHLTGRSFFRRGQVGGWRDELSAQQVARIEAAHGPMMRRLGYDLVEARSAAATAEARA